MSIPIRRIALIFLLILTLSNISISNITFASSIPATTESNTTPQEGQSGGASESWLVPDWVTDLINSIDDMIQKFKDLMSGKLIKDALVGLGVLLVDEALTPLYDAFSKGFLFTPQIAEVDGVKGAWSVVMIIGMALLFLGILYMAIKVYSGKASLGTLLKIFIGAFVINFFSLTILNIINVGVNMGTQNMLQGALETSGIIYQGLDGQQLLKALIVGVDGITDPTYADQTLGQMVVEMPGGIFVLIAYSLVIVLPFYLLIVLKQIVLIVMAVLISFWITQTAFTGKYETLIGYANLYIRTLIVSFVCAVYWAVFVQQQSKWAKGEGFLSSLGVPPIFIAIITGIALLVLVYFIWIKPLFKAIKSPVTLNGANVMEGMSKLGLKGSEVISNMGKRFGSEGLQKRASDLEEVSKNLGDSADKLKNQRSVTAANLTSRMTGGLSESIQNLEYVEPEHWIREGKDIIAVEENNVELGTAKTFVSPEKMEGDLVEKGFEAGAVIEIKADHKKTVDSQLALIDPEQREGIRWNSQTGKLFIPDAADNVYESLQNAGVDVSVIHESFEKDGLAVQMGTGKPIMIEETKAAEKTLKAVEKALPYHVETNLSPNDANQMYKELSSRADEFDWAEDLVIEDDKLWVPKNHSEDIQHVMEQMISTLTKKSRMNFPKHSKYAEKMIDEWQADENKEWAKEIEISRDGSHVYVPENYKKLFLEAYEGYRKDRIPYWRSKNGKVYVIKDGVATNYGQPPLNGLDMGSFEELQNDMQHRHAEKQKPNKPKQSSESKG